MRINGIRYGIEHEIQLRTAVILGSILLATIGANSTTALARQVTISGPQAPEFARGAWVSGKPTTLTALKGKVVLVTFWTTGCINCRRTLPYWSDWTKRYARRNDFAVVTIHTPETPGERNPAVVRQFAQQHHLTFPILIDNDQKNWDAFGIRYWPTTLLIDKQGQIRGRWEGELNYEKSGIFHDVEAEIEVLREE